ncbi:MAG: repeat containing protein [Herminiimonas sp.]|nr:repeat containing protein [Herminiimonas sp.]
MVVAQCATADGGRIARKAGLPFHHEHAMASIYFVVRSALVAGTRRFLQPTPPRCARSLHALLATAACAGLLAGCGGGGASGPAASSGGLLATDTSLSPSEFAANSLNLLAGQFGGPGSIDGAGRDARFNGISAIVFDAAGNEYVADTANNTIRKITPAGGVSTLAGLAGHAGSVDGVGTAARFSGPTGIALDGAGYIYVADTGNQTIRKISADGRVTTFTGVSGSSGSSDGARGTARFNSPAGIASDAAGNLYVADTNNLLIRKIDSTGTVITIAGSAGAAGTADGQGGAARFNGPHGIAVDSSGTLYVSDTWHFPQSHTDSVSSTIRKISPTGEVTTLAGLAGTTGRSDGSGATARFYYPGGLAVDAAGNVYVADTFNSLIRKVTPDGVVSTLAGGSGGSADGVGTAAGFLYPAGIAVDARGNLAVADTGNATVRRIDVNSRVSTVAGLAAQYGYLDGQGSDARFNGPYGLAADAQGNVYVADSFSATIRRISAAGVTTTLAGVPGIFGSADGIAGAARSSPTQPGSAQLNAAYGVAADASGNVYVADTGNNLIRKISATGMVSTLAGSAGQAGSADGQGALARFNAPYGVAIGRNGNLLVADTLNHVIRSVTPDGFVSTLAGVAQSVGASDGMAGAARFNLPYGIAAAADGTVFVGDSGNHVIRKISTAGVVTTVAGLAGSSGSSDGPSAIARFNSPQGIALDGNGTLYIADTLNATVRRLGLDGQVTTVAGVGGEDGISTATLPGRLYRPFGVAVMASGAVAVSSGNSVLLIRLK